MPSRLTVVLVSLLLATPAVIFWLWLVVLPARVPKMCTEECWCNTVAFYVNCKNSSLNNIPLIFHIAVKLLVLDNNIITSLEKDSFISRGLTELEGLTMEYCGLDTIELGAFNGLTYLRLLGMSFNEISEIIPRTFEKMGSLQYLYLSHNRLEHLESDAFCGLVNIKHIYLNGNKLQYVHPDMIVGLPNFELLGLAVNPDLQIPTDRHFINSHSLTLLDIADCNVSSVSVETFANVTALERLDMSNNNLSSVDINILKVLPKLSKLHLYCNPLNCDCQLQEVWRWCQDHNIQTASGETAPECDTPSEVQGILWGVLEKGQCLQDNIYYYGDYENTSYSYTPSEKEDTTWDLIKDRSNFSKYVRALVYVVLFTFGTTGNAILLIIIICNKDMRTIPNMYILNLAMSDMIYLMSHVFNIITDTWLESDISCTLFIFCRRLSVGLSAYSVAVLSIQRYTVTVNPIHVRVSSQPTWRVTVAKICGVWIVAALFALPSKQICIYYQIESSVTYSKRVAVFKLLVYCVLPVCVIAFSYIMTARHLMKSAQPISEETQNPQLNTRKNTATIVLGFTLVFLISYVPYHVWWTYVAFNTFQFLDEHIGNQFDYTSIILDCLLTINSSLNPVALFCTSLAFRRQFKRYLTCCCKAKPTASNIELTRRN